MPGVTPQVLNVIKQQCYPGSFTVRSFEIVGPKIGADLRQQAINVVLIALAAMLVYIAFRFEWIYGVAAVIAVFHDTIITIGLFSLFNKEIDLDRGRGAADPGRLFDERHDRDLRSHSRESEDAGARHIFRDRQHERQPDLEPDRADLRV